MQKYKPTHNRQYYSWSYPDDARDSIRDIWDWLLEMESIANKNEINLTIRSVSVKSLEDNVYYLEVFFRINNIDHSHTVMPVDKLMFDGFRLTCMSMHSLDFRSMIPIVNDP